MKKYQSINIIVVLLFVSIFTAQAQEERNQGIIWSYLHGWEYGIKAGFNIGGTSPLPLPKEIRKIDSYALGIAISIEGNATKWFDPKWGMTVGVRLENKNMTTEATVKNYGMKIINTNGGELQGLWTGGVKTKVKNSYLTIPVVEALEIVCRSIHIIPHRRRILRTCIQRSFTYPGPNRFTSCFLWGKHSYLWFFRKSPKISMGTTTRRRMESI